MRKIVLAFALGFSAGMFTDALMVEYLSDVSIEFNVDTAVDEDEGPDENWLHDNTARQIEA